MNGWRRTLTSVVTAAVAAATGAVVAASPALANSNSLWVGQIGETRGTFGPNEAVRVWGDLAFKNEGCPEDGVPDFVYPTSDVYIVVPGTAEGHLVDVTGGAPNTVVQYASVFDDEVIGITTPAGSLLGGEYDVVFDTCQDGVFQPEDDAVFSRVITIEIPGDLPPADAALTSLKEAAHAEYESWKNTQRIMNGVWKLVQKALSKGCKAGNPTACALKYGNYFNPIQEQFNGLLLNQGQHYLGIYEDPPNPDFDAPVVPAKVSASDDAIAGEGALVQALLRSVEAYKGAQQAGNEEWALVHARQTRDLHLALIEQAKATSRALEDLRALFGAEADNALVQAVQFATRVRSQGLTPDERRTLRETGLTGAQVTALESDIRAAYEGHYRASTVRDVLAAQIATHDQTLIATQQGVTAWSSIVDALEGDPAVPDTHPVAHAGGPYSATEGAAVTLDASASAAAPGATLSSYAWDLDGDRDFNDADGATPSVTFDEPGSPVVGIKVTDSAGRTGYAWASVAVARKGAGPQVTGATPSGVLTAVETGQLAGFTVTASDDAGTPAVSWAVDGIAAGTGGMLAWTAPATPGYHEVVSTVTDADGHQTTRAWDVLVFRPDADADGWTATTDCDEKDAAVHPGQIEFLGNGIDDDCDTSSPDAPPGGLTGTAYGWGANSLGQNGTGAITTSQNTPQLAVLPNTVTQVELGFRTGYALLADGSMRAWGMNGGGSLGNGTNVTQSVTPVTPLGIGGVGTLAGITRISAHSSHVGAVLSDGKVAAWGYNTNGQLGDGSTITMRNTPGLVLTGPDAPLTGVRDLEAGYEAFYAIMNDGTVKAWGSARCFGTTPARKDYATTIPGLTDIRQVAAAGSVVFFLKKDGTVLSCGDTDPILGRPWQLNTPTSPYLPSPVTGLGRGSAVVDVSAAGDSAVALKEDGTVLMWGQNTNHDLDVLGLPASGYTVVPMVVTLPAGAPVVDVEHDDSQNTLAIRADGSMLGWGGNQDGAVGVGHFNPVSVPTVVSLAGQVFLHVSTSPWNSMALTRPASDPALELPAAWVSATVADAALSEADGGAFTVTLDHALGDAVELDWALQAGTAGDDDATLRTGTVTVPVGQTQVTIPVEVADDALDEEDETLTVALTGARLGLRIARAQATGTIADNDEGPSVSVDSVTVPEGGTSLTDTAVTFRLAKPSGKEVVAAYATADGTAKAGQDYVASAATLRFAPGQTEQTVHLAVSGDAVVEPDEAFTVTLGEVTNGTAGGSGQVSISDDEVLTVSVTAPTFVEGASGDFVVTAQPAPVAGTTVTVPWSLVEPAAGSGDAPGDVASASGTLTLDRDHPSGVITATAVEDTVVESPEPFQLKLGSLAGSDGRTVLSGENGTAWITDNDVANEAPVVRAGDPVSGVEGAAISLTGTVTDDAAGVTSSWAVDGPCTVTGDGVQAQLTCVDEGTFTATLTAVDAEGATVSDSTTVSVANAAPVLGAVVVDGSGARIEFTDAGAQDRHTCAVNWGDGTTPGELAGAISPCHLPHAYGVGSFTATVVVSDDDGGSASVTRTVTVSATAWPFAGFFAPVDNAPVVNVVKAGRAIPIKFSLGGYRGMQIMAPGSPSSGVVSCGGGEPNELATTDTPGSSSLSYDAGNDQYTYVWKTESAWAGQCRRLVVSLADGTQHWAEFRFR